MNFGMHRGKTYAQIAAEDPSYCNWALRQPNPSPGLLHFKTFLQRRQSDFGSLVSPSQDVPLTQDSQPLTQDLLLTQDLPLTQDEAPAAPAEGASQESDPRAEEAAAMNNQIGRQLQQNNMDREARPVSFYLLEFSRTPVEFHNALLEAPEMVQCRLDLEANGFRGEAGDPRVLGRAKVFVPPELYKTVVDATAQVELQPGQLLRQNLMPRHVIAAGRYVEIVESVVKALPGKLSIGQRSRLSIEVESSAAPSEATPDALLNAQEWRLTEFASSNPELVSKTFIHIPATRHHGPGSVPSANTWPGARPC
jgi:hypothetical protein